MIFHYLFLLFIILSIYLDKTSTTNHFLVKILFYSLNSSLFWWKRCESKVYLSVPVLYVKFLLWVVSAVEELTGSSLCCCCWWLCVVFMCFWCCCYVVFRSSSNCQSSILVMCWMLLLLLLLLLKWLFWRYLWGHWFHDGNRGRGSVSVVLFIPRPLLSFHQVEG